jgi:intracellular sulfur oxidation DsrE/DsrF family protein
MQDTVILITKPTLGTTSPADAEFGTEMLDKFLHTLEKKGNRPKAICFYTEGVKAVSKGSPLEVGLRLLAGLGVQMIVCESCVKKYGLEGNLAVGEVGGMLEIVRVMSEAAKVITV